MSVLQWESYTEDFPVSALHWAPGTKASTCSTSMPSPFVLQKPTLPKLVQWPTQDRWRVRRVHLNLSKVPAVRSKDAQCAWGRNNSKKRVKQNKKIESDNGLNVDVPLFLRLKHNFPSYVAPFDVVVVVVAVNLWRVMEHIWRPPLSLSSTPAGRPSKAMKKCKTKVN